MATKRKNEPATLLAQYLAVVLVHGRCVRAERYDRRRDAEDAARVWAKWFSRPPGTVKASWQVHREKIEEE